MASGLFYQLLSLEPHCKLSIALLGILELLPGRLEELFGARWLEFWISGGGYPGKAGNDVAACWQPAWIPLGGSGVREGHSFRPYLTYNLNFRLFCTLSSTFNMYGVRKYLHTPAMLHSSSSRFSRVEQCIHLTVKFISSQLPFRSCFYIGLTVCVANKLQTEKSQNHQRQTPSIFSDKRHTRDSNSFRLEFQKFKQYFHKLIFISPAVCNS